MSSKMADIFKSKQGQPLRGTWQNQRFGGKSTKNNYQNGD